MTYSTTTVAAVSTPPGKGGVAIIRLSGPEAMAIADRVFRPRGGGLLSERAPRVQIYGDMYAEGEAVDDGLATRFPAPHSYTGEDTVELSCHGGVLVTRTVLEALLVAGAAPAGRGEFTRRAFLNGRLSLSAAEAIGQVIEATAPGQLRLCRQGARQQLSDTVDGLYRRLVALAGSIYARIDYPEEDLGELTPAEVLAALSPLREELDALLATYRTGRAMAEGIPTAIVGKPNVGKSSLYNLLLGEEAAIVTEIPGTTRDVLEARVSLGDCLLTLSDTAGIRPQASDPVEQLGIARSRQRLAGAELILAVFDLSRPADREDEELLDALAQAPGIRVAILNKCELPEQLSRDILARVPFSAVLTVSARTAADAARAAIRAAVEPLFLDGALHPGEDAILSTARQHAAVRRARAALDEVEAAYRAGMPEDAAASDLDRAIAALGEVDGRTVAEDVTAEIFSRFCVGK